jgi:hypothetical protein
MLPNHHLMAAIRDLAEELSVLGDIIRMVMTRRNN